MRERLIELLIESKTCGVFTDSQRADYLLANGVVVPPIELCEQIGGTIFVIVDDEPTEVLLLGVAFNYWGHDEISTYDEQGEKVRNYRFSDIGNTVFLTKEDAENVLNKMKGGVENA